MNIEILFPRRYILWIKECINFIDLRITERDFVKFQLNFSILLSLLVFFLTKNVFYSIVFFFVGFGFFVLLLYLSVENVKKQVELNLPEYISLLSSNIKSGMSLENAIINSCRKEFGILDRIFRNIGKEIFSGKYIEEVLKRYSKRYRIDVLQKFLYLLGEGIRKGSKISDLLFEISEDLRNRNSLKKEMASVVSLYTMFIFFAVTFGMPILFGITTYFVQVFQSIAPRQIDIKLPVSLPLTFSGFNVDLNFIRNFAILTILITSFFSSLMIGALKEGNERIGLKYFPIIFIIAIILYFAVQTIVSQIVGFIIF